MKVIWDVKKVWRRQVAVGQASTLEVGDVIYAGYRVRKGNEFIGIVPNVRQARDARFRRRNGIAHATVLSIDTGYYRGVKLSLGGIPIPCMISPTDEVCVVGHESGGPWWWRY
jgi:hypothetical protein